MGPSNNQAFGRAISEAAGVPLAYGMPDRLAVRLSCADSGYL
jgi:hypothetical protein